MVSTDTLRFFIFSGKMSALNEVNKVIAGVAYTPNRYNSQALDDEVGVFVGRKYR
jgi:hypothetical protein